MVKKSLSKIDGRTIGSDIEFGLIDREQGNVVPANNYFEEFDEYNTGHDHHPATGELRPLPFISGDISPTFESIKLSLEYINKKIGKEVVVVGGCAANNSRAEPLGTHIHYANIDNAKMKKFLPYLDLYMALPLLMFEDKQRAITRRTKSSYGQPNEYGQLSSYRRKEKMHKGFEYRTPSSVIISPGYTKASLALADIIYVGFLRNKLPLFLNVLEFEKEFNKCNKKFFREMKINKNELLFEKIFRQLFKLDYTKNYREYIAFLKGAIERKHSWDEQHDILPKWGIRPYPFLMINYRDHNCEAIGKPYSKNKLKRRVYLYGVNKKRDKVQVAITGRMFKSKDIKKIEKDFKINITRKSYGNMGAKEADIKVGFSYRLREENPALCRSILAEVLKKAQTKEKV